jgi:hypothetical protein
MMKINVVARIRVEIWHEGLRVLEEGASRLFEDALALPIADDVVLLASDG